MYHETFNALRCRTGAEALRLLATSDRIHTDLTHAKLFSKEFRMNLIVREWAEDILPEWEFRAFVYGNKMTAITQYTEFTFVPKIVENKNAILTLIRDKFNEVVDVIKLPDGNYTIDFAVCEDIQTCYIIELNTTPPAAGAGMFDWNDPGDRALLQSGPFEFRVQEAPQAMTKKTNETDPFKSVHPPLRRYINKLRGVPDLPLVPMYSTKQLREIEEREAQRALMWKLGLGGIAVVVAAFLVNRHLTAESE